MTITKYTSNGDDNVIASQDMLHLHCKLESHTLITGIWRGAAVGIKKEIII